MGAHTELGGVNGYLARPAGAGPWPALVVIQEWWGLDAQTESIADRFAGQGYLAFAPDLYQGEAAALGDNARAMALVQKYAPGAPYALQSVYDALRTHPQATGRVGGVGFCFGGRMALALGLSRPLDAVCTFYGGGMQQLFDQFDQLKSPVLGLFGDQDVSIPAGTIAQFEQLLTQYHLPHEIKVYPDSGHAFFRDSDPSAYRPEASRDAWEKVTAFFAQYLN